VAGKCGAPLATGSRPGSISAHLEHTVDHLDDIEDFIDNENTFGSYPQETDRGKSPDKEQYSTGSYGPYSQVLSGELCSLIIPVKYVIRGSSFVLKVFPDTSF
jgi:hypothetical protein